MYIRTTYAYVWNFIYVFHRNCQTDSFIFVYYFRKHIMPVFLFRFASACVRMGRKGKYCVAAHIHTHAIDDENVKRIRLFWRCERDKRIVRCSKPICVFVRSAVYETWFSCIMLCSYMANIGTVKPNALDHKSSITRKLMIGFFYFMQLISWYSNFVVLCWNMRFFANEFFKEIDTPRPTLIIYKCIRRLFYRIYVSSSGAKDCNGCLNYAGVCGR